MEKAKLVGDYIFDYPKYVVEKVVAQRDADHDHYMKIIKDIFQVLDKNGDRGYADNLFTIGLSYSEYQTLKSKYGVEE